MNKKIVNVEVTKKTLLRRVNNEMTSYRTYVVNLRAYVDEQNYKRLKTVINIFGDDIFEFADKEHLTKKEYQSIINELVWSCCDFAGWSIDEAVNNCNKSIDDYNSMLRRYYGIC